MAKTEYFWTDAQQASDRLRGTVVCYDGQPYYIHQIEPHDDGIPRARMQACGDGNAAITRKMLNSPKFKRFRELPNLGWMNHSDPRYGALFVSRRIVAGGRSHGLCGSSVTVMQFLSSQKSEIPTISASGFSFNDVAFNKGFVDCHNNVFPSLEKILSNIKPGTSIAFSPMFCVVRSQDGLRWMYRNLERIGIFTGVDTLNLISKYAYLREEIMADKAFTLNNLREF